MGACCCGEDAPITTHPSRPEGGGSCIYKRRIECSGAYHTAHCTFYAGFQCEDVCKYRVCCRSNGDCELTNRVDCFDGHWREDIVDCLETDCDQRGTCCHGEYPNCKCEDDVSIGWCKYHTQNYPMEFYPNEHCEDESCRCLKLGACCYHGGLDEHGDFYCLHETQEECLHADGQHGGEVQGVWMGEGTQCETDCVAEGRCCIPHISINEENTTISWSCENIGYAECHDKGGFFNQYTECIGSDEAQSEKCNKVYLDILLQIIYGAKKPLPALIVTDFVPLLPNPIKKGALGENAPPYALANNSFCDEISPTELDPASYEVGDVLSPSNYPIRADWYGTPIMTEEGIVVGLTINVQDACCCPKYLLFMNCCGNQGIAFAVALNCEGIPEEWQGSYGVFDFVYCMFSLLFSEDMGGHIVREVPEGVSVIYSFDFLIGRYFVPLDFFDWERECHYCCGEGEDKTVVDLYDPCPSNASYCDAIEQPPPTNCKKGAHYTPHWSQDPLPMVIKYNCRCFKFFTRIPYWVWEASPQLQEQYANIGHREDLLTSCSDCGFQIYQKCPENELGCSGTCSTYFGNCDTEPEYTWACKTELLNEEQFGCTAPRVRGDYFRLCHKYIGDSDIAIGERVLARCHFDVDQHGTPIDLQSCCNCCEPDEGDPCDFNCECLPTSITIQMTVMNHTDTCAGPTATLTWVQHTDNQPDDIGGCKMMLRVDNLCGAAICQDTPPNDPNDCIRHCDFHDYFGQITPEQYYVMGQNEDMTPFTTVCVERDGGFYMAFGGAGGDAVDKPRLCQDCGSQNCTGCLPCGIGQPTPLEEVLLPLGDCGPCAQGIL